MSHASADPAFSHALRPLSPDERAWIGSETVVVRERLANEDRSHTRARVGAARGVSGFALLFALIAALNWWWQASTPMLISLGATLLLAGVAAWIRLVPLDRNLADTRRLDMLESANTRAEALQLRISTDAVLDLRSSTGDRLGLLLRAGERIVYLSHHLLEEFAGERVAERIPSELTVVSIVPLGVQAIETGGALLDPIAEHTVLDDQNPLWSDSSIMVWLTVATGELTLVELADGHTEPYVDDAGLTMLARELTQPSATTPAGSE